jgi:hypothetical protein
MAGLVKHGQVGYALERIGQAGEVRSELDWCGMVLHGRYGR